MTNFLIGILELTAGMSLLIALALLCLCLFGKRFTSKCRYVIWTLVLVRLAIPFTGGFLPALIEVPIEAPAVRVEVPENYVNTPTVPEDGEFQVPSTSAETHTPQITPPYIQGGQIEVQNPTSIPEYIESEGVSRPSDKADKVITTADVVSVIAVIYFAGAIIFLLWNLLAYFIYTRQVLKNARKASPEWQKHLVAVCTNKKLKSVPEFYVSEGIHSPVAFGLFRRKIVLPDIELSVNGVVGTLAHEVTHCKRGDLIVKFIVLFARAINWFNPLVHIAALRCETEMELSCDEAVLAGMSEDVRRSYGDVMLDIVKRCSGGRSLLTTHFNPRKSAVKERILNILDMTKKSRGRAIIAAFLVLCVIAGTVIGCTVTDGNKPNGEEGENTEPGAYESLSDFLTDEQIAVFETADVLFPLFNGSPFDIDSLHLDLDNADFDTVQAYLADKYSSTPSESVEVGRGIYRLVRGEYDTYKKFESLCLSVFTREYFDELNRVTFTATNEEYSCFIDIDGKFYYFDAAKGTSWGYAPDEYPDTYELVSKTEDEICFNVIGYFKSSYVSPIYTVGSQAYSVTLVRTDDGWRFSHFSDPLHGTPDSTGSTFSSYFGKGSIEELTELDITYEGEETTLGAWVEKTHYYPLKYSIVDLDGDREHEMVFLVAIDAIGDGGHLILHADGETVYAHMLHYRSFRELKTDGRFSFSGSAAITGIGKLEFSGDSYVSVTLVYREADMNDPTGGTVEYTTCLDGYDEFGEAEYNAYYDEWESTPAAVWHDMPEITAEVKYTYDVTLADGIVKTLEFTDGYDPSIYAESHTAQIDDSGVPNPVILHKIDGGTGVYVNRPYVLDGTTGDLISVTPVDEVIRRNVSITVEDDAWILKTPNEEYRIEKSDFSYYSDDQLAYIPDMSRINNFFVVKERLICKVGILCAGPGTGFAEKYLYIEYGYENGEIVPVRFSFQAAATPYEDSYIHAGEIPALPENPSAGHEPAYIQVETISALPKDPSEAWRVYEPMMSPIYYFFDNGLTYYCRYEYNGEHFEKNTLFLPEGYTNGEIFYVRGTGGSASMYIIVKTDQGYLRYYSAVGHGPDEILSVHLLTDDELEYEKICMANDRMFVSPSLGMGTDAPSENEDEALHTFELTDHSRSNDTPSTFSIVTPSSWGRSGDLDILGETLTFSSGVSESKKRMEVNQYNDLQILLSKDGGGVNNKIVVLDPDEVTSGITENGYKYIYYREGIFNEDTEPYAFYHFYIDPENGRQYLVSFITFLDCDTADYLETVILPALNSIVITEVSDIQTETVTRSADIPAPYTLQ